MQHAESVRVRQELLDRLRTELVGPNSDSETLDERPTQRYVSGILWPIGTRVGGEEDEITGAGAEGEESGVSEHVAPLAAAMRPSSIGLSFMVDTACKAVSVTADWGSYTASQDRWTRRPITIERYLDLSTADGRRRSEPLTESVFLEWLARPTRDGRCLAVSVFLVNRALAPKTGGQDAYCCFQARLVLVAAPGSEPKPFRVRRLEYDEGIFRTTDTQVDDLLYREETVFAIGHGVAVDWCDVSPDRQRAGRISTEVMPTYEVPQQLPPEWTAGGNLSMDALAKATSDAVGDMLSPLCDAYDEWLNGRELQMSSLPTNLLGPARDNLAACRQSLNRIREGIDLIRSNPLVLKAFQFANQAMADQRRQVLYARNAKRTGQWIGGADRTIKPEWRPFQIAFILQTLAGLVDPGHSDRQIADLLWFPTGGGKTEAYLGLAAFAMAFRRLSGNGPKERGDAGLSVIMRYTLRLLTIQQFQRAATLICACEQLRKQDPKTWGAVPFRIGLWVGQKSTPNTFDECVSFLEGKPQRGSPLQLVTCPWCGAPLVKKNSSLHKKTYVADRRARRLIISCSRTQCEFHRTQSADGIPALVVDEEIYRLAPSMLIGTIDKFARMPWVGETQALFGKVDGEVPGWGFVCAGDADKTQKIRQETLRGLGRSAAIADGRSLLPPDLIIQDELHLISGPLGSIVGLYESAVDALCSRKIGNHRVGPKIVASTATIRRAGVQVKMLFSRRLAVFPSSGLDAGDSFFSKRQSLDERPGRLYVGLFAPGRSVKTALVRTYSTLLASPDAIAARPEDLDPYKTLVGYFNSLRELGGAVRLLEDDVRARVSALAKRSASNQKFSYANRELRDHVPELTSRVDSKDIPDILDRLERTFPGSPEQPPLDAVLASNMISVGVDVTRLGLMVVTGQPKTTAEYIQATSRVGREFPGLVVTVYNWARPRDLSHYEQFRGYHAAIYRYVEAMSVTPFASRARDRALAAVLVSLCRLSGPDLAPWASAVKFDSMDTRSRELVQDLIARVEATEGAERAGEVARELKSYLDQWDTAASRGRLVYSGGRAQPRVIYPLGEERKQALFPAPNSMRDVEPTLGIYLEQEDYS